MSLHPASHNPRPGLLQCGLRCKISDYFLAVQQLAKKWTKTLRSSGGKAKSKERNLNIYRVDGFFSLFYRLNLDSGGAFFDVGSAFDVYCPGAET